MHLVLHYLLESAENEDDRNSLIQSLQVEEWRIQRQIEQRTRLVPREPGAPAWWFGDDEAYETSNAAAVQLRRGGSR
jgi:hypothetical protein